MGAGSHRGGTAPSPPTVMTNRLTAADTVGALLSGIRPVLLGDCPDDQSANASSAVQTSYERA